MIIACDLDRTLIPNGREPDDGSLKRFYSYIETLDHTLVYATGRNLKMLEEAYALYGLKKPDFLIAAVGTAIYKRKENEIVLDTRWGEHVYSKNPLWNNEKITSVIKNIDYLTFQEKEVQNEFKISLYVDLLKEKKEIEEDVRSVLNDTEGIEVVYSIDPDKHVGLVDILPTSATKLGALEYVRTMLNKEKEEVIYAGDSGNDILPLTHGYKAILVKNAPSEVAEEVRRIVKDKNISHLLYVACGDDGESGNYASGVMEGIKYFLKG
jgi:sucrose-6-phosphatase